MSNEMILDSLRRRMRAMFSLYEEATATMTVAQVNHREREGILPMAFSLFHYIHLLDGALMMLNAEPPIWDVAWESRGRFRRRSPAPSARGWPESGESPFSTASNAGSTNMVCGTWERSNWPVASWGCRA